MHITPFELFFLVACLSLAVMGWAANKLDTEED